MDGKRKWFEPTITVGNVLTMVTLLAAIGGAWNSASARLATLEAQTAIQQRTNERQERESTELRREVRDELRLMNAKLDRSIETRNERIAR